MKIRYGFVSNSSSSNFILAFPHKPISAEDVHRMMFGEARMLSHPYSYHRDEAEQYSTTLVAETVWNDIKDKEPITTEAEIIEEIGSGWFDGYPQHNYHREDSYKFAEDFERKHGKPIYRCQESNPVEYQQFHEMRNAEWEAEKREIAEAANKFWNKHRLPKDHVKYVVSYSDNDGSFGCFMEHGGVFDGLKHIQISHH
jgi:hypothetical protein